jgi:hypothetical protein
MVTDQNALEQFQKQWLTYHKLVDADALSHRAAGYLLRDSLCAIPTPFRPCRYRLRRREPDARSFARH